MTLPETLPVIPVTCASRDRNGRDTPMTAMTRCWAIRVIGFHVYLYLRLLISADERQQFRERVEAFREEVRVELGYAIGADLSRSIRASMNRRAVSWALVSQGILEFRWRQITLPILRQESVTIS